MSLTNLLDLKKVGVPYKFIAKDDPELTSARLSLVMGFAKSARLFLEILGIEHLEPMWAWIKTTDCPILLSVL